MTTENRDRAGNGAAFNEQVAATAAYAEVKAAVGTLRETVTSFRRDVEKQLREMKGEIARSTHQHEKDMETHTLALQEGLARIESNPMMSFGRFLRSGKGFVITAMAVLGAIGSAAWAVSMVISALKDTGVLHK